MAGDLLLLDNDDVAGVLDIGDCMAALERAYRALADGQSVERARSQMRVPLAEPGVTYCFKSMEGALVGDGYSTLRITSDAVFEGRVDGRRRRDKLPRGEGGTYCGLIFVFSTRDLAPVAIIHDGLIQLVRVACTSALSVRLLAREDAADLGLIGAGQQAWWHLRAASAVRKLRRIRVYSPNAERRTAFARRAAAELGIPVDPVDTARDAVGDADIVIAATNASEPVLDGRWLDPGALVVSIVSGDKGSTRRELDDETLRRAALVVAHSKSGAMEHRNGDLAGPVDAGILSWEKNRRSAGPGGRNLAAPRRTRRHHGVQEQRRHGSAVCGGGAGGVRARAECRYRPETAGGVVPGEHAVLIPGTGVQKNGRG